ncbi:4623_t:CDS:1 [Paraglomus occultum]|uniref:4623_t:CDS:1 n=1 Tax=Paraglomus occultum TaxID=144539 RepID=A0A9N8WC39_9GLOM|nr:4623_t:CDS:1 [Paraglomus occultum]
MRLQRLIKRLEEDLFLLFVDRNTTSEQVELLRSLWHEFTKSHKTLLSVETAYLQISGSLRQLILTTDEQERQEIWESIKRIIETHKKNNETVVCDTNEASAAVSATKPNEPKRAPKRGLDHKPKPRKKQRPKVPDLDTQIELTENVEPGNQHPPPPVLSPIQRFDDTSSIRQEQFFNPSYHPVFSQYNTSTEAPNMQPQSSPSTALTSIVYDILPPSTNQFSPLAMSSPSIFHTSYSQNFQDAFSRSAGQSQITDNVEIVPSQDGGDSHEEGNNGGW